MSSINCEDLAEFAKSQGRKPDSYLNENRQTPFFAGEFYRNSAEHLQEELARIGALIRFFLEKTGAEVGEESQDFGGLFISEAEVNSIIQAVCCGSATCGAQGVSSR